MSANTAIEWTEFDLEPADRLHQDQPRVFGAGHLGLAVKQLSTRRTAQGECPSARHLRKPNYVP